MRPNRQIAPVACSLVYEFMHFCCHVDENSFVRNAPFANTIRRHHTAHHDQSIMMERNLNLTFPIMDRLFSTSDLLGFFMIFAMWLFPEAKRDDTAGGVRRDAPLNLRPDMDPASA